ncbi:MAG: S8 family serine peptidase [Bdellovibrionales bacterium]|nr:S8 family serine peptidase [Bdellovibrionales bacterium]
MSAKNRVSHLLSIHTITFFTLILSACSNGALESQGTIAVVNGQHQLIEDQKQADEACANPGTYCEPNYTVYAFFGRRRSQPSFPGVPTIPTPRPTPKPPRQHVGAYSHDALNVDQAWSRTRGSASVVVAVIDSGATFNHPDLVAHLDPNGYDFLRNTSNPYDEAGHGTHVSGIIAQIAPEVKIMPLKFIAANGSGGTYAAIQAIDYAVAHHVQVINASWGGPAYSSLLGQAVKRATDAGVTFVAAAGNESRNFNLTPSYPAAFAGVISVAASDAYNQLAEYSNFGSNVTIAAPGDEIISTVMSGGWDYMSGTSMASPQVAGTVALLKSVRDTASQDEVKQELCQSAGSFQNGATQCGEMNTGKAVANF